MVRTRKELIEVALPLDTINKASARAVIFAQMVDNPSAYVDELRENGKLRRNAELDDILAELERERLFRIIEDLVLWENTTNEAVLQQTRDEIGTSWRCACADNACRSSIGRRAIQPGEVPSILRPIAGGGTLPLPSPCQRLRN
jgi:putative DNA methylase